MTSSNGNIFRVTGPLCGEFTGPGEIPTQRPVTRSFDVFFDLRLYKRLSKQSWGWWFETLSHPLWRHRNVWPDTQEDVMIWRHFPHYWPFVRGIHRSPKDFPTKANDAELSCLLLCASKQTVDQRVKLSVSWDAMVSMWRLCNNKESIMVNRQVRVACHAIFTMPVRYRISFHIFFYKI